MNYFENILSSLGGGIQSLGESVGWYNPPVEKPTGIAATNAATISQAPVTSLNASGAPEVKQVGETETLTTEGGWNWGNIGEGLQGASSIADSYINYMNFKNAEDQLNFTKDAWQQNYDQSLAAYNRQVERQDSKEAALGSTETLQDRQAK